MTQPKSDERERLIEELEKKNAELERFTYTVSHDLKSPLITIKGFLGLLESDLDSGNLERLRADMHRIADAADKMSSLLDELLELSRIGRVVNASEWVPLVELVDEALGLLMGPLRASAAQVVVGPDLPVLKCDRARLREVVQNLVENAIKFMGPQTDPCIEIGARWRSDEVVVFVRDNGEGFEPEYGDKIFALFEQLDPIRPGSGVGLALVQRIVEVHGGRTWAESDGPGLGATFFFAAPMHAARPTPASSHE